MVEAKVVVNSMRLLIKSLYNAGCTTNMHGKKAKPPRGEEKKAPPRSEHLHLHDAIHAADADGGAHNEEICTLIAKY